MIDRLAAVAAAVDDESVAGVEAEGPGHLGRHGDEVTEQGRILRLSPRFARTAEAMDEKPATRGEPPLSIPVEASAN